MKYRAYGYRNGLVQQVRTVTEAQKRQLSWYYRWTFEPMPSLFERVVTSKPFAVALAFVAVFGALAVLGIAGWVEGL